MGRSPALSLHVRPTCSRPNSSDPDSAVRVRVEEVLTLAPVEPAESDGVDLVAGVGLDTTAGGGLCVVDLTVVPGELTARGADVHPTLTTTTTMHQATTARRRRIFLRSAGHPRWTNRHNVPSVTAVPGTVDPTSPEATCEPRQTTGRTATTPATPAVIRISPMNDPQSARLVGSGQVTTPHQMPSAKRANASHPELPAWFAVTCPFVSVWHPDAAHHKIVSFMCGYLKSSSVVESPPLGHDVAPLE